MVFGEHHRVVIFVGGPPTRSKKIEF